jgi:hypothetical protein
MSISKIAQVLKGKSSYILQNLWGRGYFCATVGIVNEETIKNIHRSKTMNIHLKFGTMIYPHRDPFKASSHHRL